MKFKTNVMCGNCIAKITPCMDKLAGKHNWEVDLKDPKRILTVKNKDINAEDVLQCLSGVGYKAEPV